VLSAALALAASAAWGLGDFAGGLKSRVLPALTVIATSQPFGLAALVVVLAVRGTPPPGPEVAWACLAAVLGTLGLLAFYRGLAGGTMTVVAPLAALAAAFPIVVGAASGDPIDGAQAVGFAAALGGSVLTSLERHEERTRLAAGAGWALLALVGFGGYYVPMHAAAAQDWLWPTFVFRCTTVLLAWSAVLARRAWPRGLKPHLRVLALVGLLDTAGVCLFAAASATHGLVSVVSVLASLYSLVTVMLARVVLGERVQRTQEVGVVVAIVGIVLVTAG